MATVHATAVVDPAARLGDGVEVGPFCTVGPQVAIGARTRLLSHVNIEGVTEIGEDCVIHPFSSLGGPPQHASHKGDATRLVVGDRNLIREHVTMNVGSSLGAGVTRVGSDNAFFAAAHVGHDCVVGNHVLLTNLATLAGHVTLEDYVILGGFAGVHQHGRIGRYAFVGAHATVSNDVIPFGMAWGNHAKLDGLNVVGLKRRGFSRPQIHTLRAAYRQLFLGDGAFQDRVACVAETYAGSAEVMEIIDFIRADPLRAVCMPVRD
jgi:UDP-N-acetylglucosamine acyltransferase